MKKYFVPLIAFVFISFSFAQEASESTAGLEDDLFGGDNEMEVTPEQANAETKKDPLTAKGDLQTATLSLENTKFRIGGSLNSELSLKYLWIDPYTPKGDHTKAFSNPEQALLLPTLGANLFFDARPVPNLKLYGKFVFGFPFEKSLNGTAVAPPPLPPGTTVPVTVNGSPNIKIWELYTDFSAKDIAFFRFGKHTVKWGTGYFYSPADVINISRINPQNPREDREGPVSLRTHIAIPRTQYNIWLYLLPDTEQAKPQNTAAAGKAEFVFGGTARKKLRVLLQPYPAASRDKSPYLQKAYLHGAAIIHIIKTMPLLHRIRSSINRFFRQRPASPTQIRNLIHQSPHNIITTVSAITRIQGLQARP